MKDFFQSNLTHPLARDIDIDSPDATVDKSRIIQSKLFLKNFYKDCYRSIIRSIPQDINGIVLEIGSGAGFLKNYLPDLVTSEILSIPSVDIVLDAQAMPFGRNCLRAIVMVDVFHHLPDVKSFLTDSIRCVRPGGTVVMVEPWITRWSYFIYRFFHHEPINLRTEQWPFPGKKPLSSANSALPWIVFQRDRQKFQKEFPGWHIDEIKLDYPFTYLVSGGVSYRSPAPGRLFWLFRQFERLFQPIMGFVAMFAKITLRRVEISR